MSWEYANRNNESSEQAARGLRVPFSYEGIEGDGVDPLSGYDSDARQGLDEHAAIVTRGAEIQVMLDRLFHNELYAPLDSRRSNSIAVVRGVASHYARLMADPHTASTLMHSRATAPEWAAVSMAALSMAGQAPMSGLSGGLVRIFGGIGERAQALHDNLNSARGYLVANRVLLAYPDGAPGMPSTSLPGFTSRDLRDLREHQLGRTGLRRIPAFLAVLAANVVQDKHSPLAPEMKGASQRDLQEAEATVRQMDRYRRHSGAYADRINLQPRDQKALQKAQELLAAQKERDAIVEDRKKIEKAVLEAGKRWFGFTVADIGKIGLMAECLVAQAHDFENASPQLKQVLAMRMREAARKTRGLRGASDLPTAAQALYTQYISYSDNSLTGRRAV